MNFRLPFIPNAVIQRSSTSGSRSYTEKVATFGTVYRLSLKFILLSTVYCLLSTGLCGCQNKLLYRDSQIIMGTIVEVISPDKRASRIVFDEIKRIEGLLSKYRQDSEISRLNKQGSLMVSPDTLFIMKEAKRFWMLSNGAFDVTVGPLLDIWGFTDKNYKVPKESEIKKTLKLVDSDKIIIDEKNNLIKLKVKGMKVDLGAIAKGYAVDCAINKLRKAKIKSCLINAGGDIYCLGDKPRTFGPFDFIFLKVRDKFSKPWNVAVKNPRDKDSIGNLELKNKAVATSGDYEQYFINQGKRYSHVFNPKTGYPADSGVISVTVIASDCLTADALATSIFVLGKEKGQELAKRFPNIEVKIVEEKE